MHTREGLLSVWKDPLHCFGLPAITALVRESVCVCVNIEFSINSSAEPLCLFMFSVLSWQLWKASLVLAHSRNIA